jgi:hypothetical protein
VFTLLTALHVHVPQGVIVPTKETYITSATCSKQLEKENRDKDKDRDGGAAYLSVELEFPNDVLRKYLASKNLEVSNVIVQYSIFCLNEYVKVY